MLVKRSLTLIPLALALNLAACSKASNPQAVANPSGAELQASSQLQSLRTEMSQAQPAEPLLEAQDVAALKDEGVLTDAQDEQDAKVVSQN